LEVNQITSLLYGITQLNNHPIPLKSIYFQTFSERLLGYYSMNTLPFISSSNGWTNLPSLGGTPCPDYPISSSMPTITKLIICIGEIQDLNMCIILSFRF
jgi:hypothetical protein